MLRSRFSSVGHQCAKAAHTLRFVHRALLGAFCGAVLFLGVSHNLPLNMELKFRAGAVFTGVCTVGGACSALVRCSLLLTFPFLLGSRGRAYIFLLLLTQLYSGPWQNLQNNIQACAMSLSCNMDLQVNNSRLLWKQAMIPFLHIAEELTGTDLGSESKKVGENYKSFKQEVYHHYGGNSKDTDSQMQQKMSEKTMLQCDDVVRRAKARCVEWFNKKWLKCMATIALPIVNNLLCLVMKSSFLCDILHVMTPWCTDRMPLGGNTGKLWDKLDKSMVQFEDEFRANVAMEEEENQDFFDGIEFDKLFVDSVKDSLNKLRSGSEFLMNVLETAKSLTFITVFFQAVRYLWRYRTNLHFDNVYITSYFRCIESRRKTRGKRCILPLGKSDKSRFIKPWSLRIHPQEMSRLFSGVVQSVSFGFLTLALGSLDLVLFHILEIVSRNTVTQFNVTAFHHVQLKVEGVGTMARLLRKTIRAFNHSSHIDVDSSNIACAVVPASLSVNVYYYCAACVLMLMLWSLLAIYTSRLRRFICAFNFPKREKSRVLFLYNLILQRYKKHWRTDVLQKRFESSTKWNNVCALCPCYRPKERNQKQKFPYQAG